MTTDKARKRAVRTRMQKTGERYAAARRHVTAEPDVPAEPTLPPRVADPGMTDEAIRKGTGRDWDDWFRVLDTWGATGRTHTDIARHVHETFDVTGWWAQGVTVGYERARGMRARHETTSGFEVSVSRTIAATPAELWPFLSEAALRDGWVDPDVLRPRTRAGVTGKHARFDVVADATRVAIYLTPKGETKTVVTVTHERLHGPDDVATRRAFWRERVGRLATRAGSRDTTPTGRPDNGLPSDFGDLWSTDRDRQNAAYTRLMALTDGPVDWAYAAWDDVVTNLASKDNHDRAIAAQLLCNLAKSDPAGRLIDDFAALMAVTKDDRFVTARHALHSLWKVGVAGEAQRALLLEALDGRYRAAPTEKNGTLVRADIIQNLRDLSDVVADPAIESLAISLIELEDDPKYRKKYAATWRSTRRAA